MESHENSSTTPVGNKSICFDATCCLENPDHDVDIVMISLLFSSCIFLLPTIGTYLLLPELLNKHGKCIVAHLVCLKIFFLTQLTEIITLYKLSENLNSNDFTVGWSFPYCWILGKYLHVFKTI